MSTPEERIRRARDAEAMANDERFQRLMRDTEDQIVQQWKAESDPVRREELHAEIRGLKLFMARIKADITSGAIALASERSKATPI